MNSEMIKQTLFSKWILIAAGFILLAVIAVFSNYPKEVGGSPVIQKEFEENQSLDTSPDEIVVFEDNNLENLVREELSIFDGDITVADMQNLYSININKAEVVSLGGLEHATELLYFSLLHENVDSLDPIKNLSNLERINISYSTIQDLPIEFSSGVNPNSISIIDTQIGDVSFLAHMTNVEHLTVTDAGIKDISALAGLDNLVRLNLSRNEIGDISVLVGKDKLESLNLQTNQVSDISSLAGLASLSEVTLSYNPVYNLKPLEDLPNLTSVRIYLDHDVKSRIFDQVGELEKAGVQVDYHR